MAERGDGHGCVWQAVCGHHHRYMDKGGTAGPAGHGSSCADEGGWPGLKQSCTPHTGTEQDPEAAIRRVQMSCKIKELTHTTTKKRWIDINNNVIQKKRTKILYYCMSYTYMSWIVQIYTEIMLWLNKCIQDQDCHSVCTMETIQW